MVREPDFGEPDEKIEAMGDPGVVYLRYRFIAADAEFRAPSLDIEQDEFLIHVDDELTAYALALTDAVRGEDKAGIKAAGKAIVDAVRAYQEAIETGRLAGTGGLERHTSHGE